MIVDGRQVAAEILADVKARAARLPRAPQVVALVGEETRATLSYLKIKKSRAHDAGCTFEVRPLGSSYDDADAVIIQLPLPQGLDQKKLCDGIPVAQDADVLSAAARDAFLKGKQDALLPPVAGAVQEILKRSHIDPRGKSVAVVGNGWLVGNPVAAWLKQQGATVAILTSSSQVEQSLPEADIVVSGAGVPHLIKPDYLKGGVVLIDAGTSESSGALAGDADPACAEAASVFTPVPGGVGPIAVAWLFNNVVTLAERAHSSIPST